MPKSLLIYFIGVMTRFLPGSPFRRLRGRLWRLAGVMISPSANIMPDAVFFFGAPGTGISVGDNTFIGYQALVTGGEVAIGADCDLAPRCIIHAGTHKIGPAERRAGESTSGRISIGPGSWIGTGAIILADAHLGRGTIVAAGSVVMAGSYPDNVLLAGVPAKVKKTLS